MSDSPKLDKNILFDSASSTARGQAIGCWRRSTVRTQRRGFSGGPNVGEMAKG